MLTILKSSANGFQPVGEWSPGCWVNVWAPTPAEREQLSAHLKTPREWLDHSLDLNERARVEHEEGALFIVLRLPHRAAPQAEVPYITVPVGIIVTNEQVVTLCPVETPVVAAPADQASQPLGAGNTNRFLLRLLFTAADAYLDHVREINHIVDELESKLQRSLRNQEVLELLKYQKSLVYFITGLKSNELMLDRLQRSHLFEQHPEDLELLEDVMIEVRQALEQTEILANILSQMMDAFASIISNNLNVVMKFLAIVTILLSLPTLIASVYGMNVALPLQHHPLAFLIIIAGSLAIAVGVTWVFWKRDWF